ncbi:hypothetical protein SODALDRAFT_324674 [Sodiomyces alkalinus F11]|uniref:Uncharacterized protein n=1 Tax=Sodiomyces alkalinus (strain CBS 110278 / VKM F-3762 / F11) TaxID=1314773 RepID=A0A3N2PUW8_SODAK|nr:hypothetical protein SODALDRAFT_324674 [Sodiomyces alkalinus F11]ROT38292.1 hypothetical protein SODALDRAFT_324674 [Sodiomyces alkalinus F11]
MTTAISGTRRPLGQCGGVGVVWGECRAGRSPISPSRLCQVTEYLALEPETDNYRLAKILILRGRKNIIRLLKVFGKRGYVKPDTNKKTPSNKRKRGPDDTPTTKTNTALTINLEGIPKRYIRRLRKALIAAAKDMPSDKEELTKEE